ncbi:MAG: RnfH family protein [Xanthomonadales bacterium]|nr:RnfH family protein [Xanthomonadales bacterium]NIX11737.1 RnfH family protein [Xanthomonadales bacterium]
MPASLSVEVVHARPERQVLLRIEVSEGTTVMQAIEMSGILQAFPDLEVDPARLGVFGQKAGPDDVLREGDRVEIYRPLIADPKESRRKRAALRKG